MATVGFRASRGFWHNGRHVAGSTLIIIGAAEARKLQQEGKGKMELTRYPGRLDRGPVFEGNRAYEGDQIYVRPDDEEPGWKRKDEDCEPCPQTLGVMVAEEGTKKIPPLREPTDLQPATKKPKKKTKKTTKKKVKKE